jgi:hypothetical protein
MNWLKLVEQLTPIILGATPLAAISPFVTAGIQVAEQIPGADGPTKLGLAIQITNLGVAATNAQAGHTAIDPALVNSTIQTSINSVVAVVNLINSFKTAAPAPPTL